MLNYKNITGLIIVLLMVVNLKAQVNPEIQLGARGVMSFNTDIVSDGTTSAVNDFSDTGILLGFRQKLYSNFRGQFVLGFQFPDADSDLGQVFFHQTFLQIEDKSNILKMGRSRVRSALIEFPTLRDDDALPFTDVLNPFSTGVNTEDHQYGNVIELTHIFNQRYWLRIHGEHFTRMPDPLETFESDFSLNAIGFSFQYIVPAAQIWNRPFIQQVGIGFNNFLTDFEGYSNEFDRTLKNISFSAIFNIKRDPVHFWDLRSQVIYNMGLNGIAGASDFMTLTKAKAVSGFMSLRYLFRKLERPNLQVAFLIGYKIFPDFNQPTNQMQFISNAFYRIGENFDAGLQIQYSQFQGDLIKLFGKDETRIQFSLVYSIDAIWNNQFDDRESLLNLEHGYIP